MPSRRVYCESAGADGRPPGFQRGPCHSLSRLRSTGGRTGAEPEPDRFGAEPVGVCWVRQEARPRAGGGASLPRQQRQQASASALPPAARLELRATPRSGSGCAVGATLQR